MYYGKLPYGVPKKFDREYKEDKIYDLYVQKISCIFKLKKGKIPTIQVKHNMHFVGNEYLETSNGEFVTLVLTNIDLKLFYENYDVILPVYLGGYKFKSMTGFFKDYIDYWTEIKIEAGKNNNSGMRAIAKLMLNSLYGKFALSPKAGSKKPYLSEDGIVKYENNEKDDVESIYIPVRKFYYSTC